MLVVPDVPDVTQHVLHHRVVVGAILHLTLQQGSDGGILVGGVQGDGLGLVVTGEPVVGIYGIDHVPLVAPVTDADAVKDALEKTENKTL